MADRRARLTRLYDLLPRIYAAQPRGSAVGDLLDALAGALADLDENMERALRDRWISLADGSPLEGNGPSPLELLGHAIDVRRESWESTEAYRRRLRLTSAILARGLSTPQATMALATAALDTELCPRLQRHLDTTVGWGMVPGTARLCLGCQGIQEGPCSSLDARLVELRVTDNPTTSRRLRHGPLVPEQTFVVRSRSFHLDLPVISLRAIDGPLRYPAVQNLETQEVMLFAGDLDVSETLTVRPLVEEGMFEPFDGYDSIGHHPWRTIQPRGSAVVVREEPVDETSDQSSGGAEVANRTDVRDVSDSIYYFRGYAFDAVTFAGNEGTEVGAPRFAALHRQMRTPQINPGDEQWVFRAFTKDDIKAIAAEELGEDLQESAPDEPIAQRVEVVLEWWTRPPATFILRMPKTPTIRKVENTGVVDLIRRSIDRARAAGVRAIFDMPEPVRLESHTTTDRLATLTRVNWLERAASEDSTFSVSVSASHQERHGPPKETFAIQGIFDVTRLDWTQLAP